MSRLNDIADAVADLLGDIVVNPYFADSIDVERVYIPLFKVETRDAERIVLFVMAADDSTDLNAGNQVANPETHVVLIAIYKKVNRESDGTISADECDEMMDFRQEVIDSLRANKRLPTYDEAKLQAMPSTGAAYDVSVLDTSGVFVSVIRLEYTLLNAAS